MNKRFVLFASTGVGLGHLLTAIISTAYYAWRTGRVLALDMREVHFFAKNNHAAFFENFALNFPPDLEIITDLEVIDALRRDPDLHYLRAEDRLNTDDPFSNRGVMVPCISPGSSFRPNYKRAEAEFHIDLRGPLLEALEKTLAMPQWGGRVIGLHYRATVGELFDRMTKLTVPDYDERYARIMDDYVATALQLVEGASSESYSFLIASDDRAFIKEMKERLPSSFSLSTKLLDREFAAYMRENNFDISILMDAVIDMWSLSRCEQFIYSRSAFSNFVILNSPSLDETNTHYIHMPLFDEILDSIAPETAVEWARAAVRKVEISRMHYNKSHRSLLRALDRAGQGNGPEANAIRQRIQWHWEVNESPAIDNPDVFEARALERGGRNDLLLERLQAAIAHFPGNPFFLAGYGGAMSDLLTKLGRLEEAVAPARQAVVLAPADPFLHEALGVALMRVGDAASAETSLRLAIQLDSDVASFHVNLADCLSRLGRVDEALSVAHRAADLDPADSLPHARMGDALMNAGQFAEAEASFRKAAEINPRDPGHFHRLSIALERQGRMEDAIAASEQGALAEPRQFWSLERVAALNLAIGKPAAAEDAARRLIARQPDNAKANILLGEALQQQGRQAEAVDAAQRSTDLNPTNPEQFLRSALAAVSAQDFPSAEAAASAAIALSPQNAGYYHVLGVALERQGKLEQAISVAQTAVDLDPSDLGRTVRVATMRLGAGQFEEAVKYLKTAFDRHPSSAQLNDLLSDALVSLDRLADALIPAQEAARLEATTDRELRILELRRRVGIRERSLPSFAPFVRADSVASGGRHAVAVLVRSHKCDAKFHDLMGKLSSGAMSFDLYGIVNSTDGRPDTKNWPIVWHSAQEFRDIGLTQRHQILFNHCGDFPLYFALRDIPFYDFYIMVEDDVDLVEGSPDFLNEICEVISRPGDHPFGLSGINFMNAASFPQSPWHDANKLAAAKLVGESNVCYTTFPFMVFSKPLLALLFSQRQLEAARGLEGDDIVNCEVFAPSIAKAAGFRVCDLKDLVPGCYDPYSMMLHCQHAGYGRPLGYNLEQPGTIRILHPIYDVPEFLVRIRTKYVQHCQPGASEVLRSVEETADNLIAPELKAEVRRLLAGVV